ncbi:MULTISPECIES: hypothetical protein [Fervidobacterium]|nr:hypothetical protein [Fervidobacterium changbaicum]QAV33999.1 hypothetical protein CBS1_10020 [Fervidobacterium changbaicum]
MAFIGIIASTVTRKRVSADAITIFLLGFFYIIGLIARIYEKYAYLKNLTPFGVFDPADIIKTESFNNLALILVFILYIAGILFSVVYYERKDIYA